MSTNKEALSIMLAERNELLMTILGCKEEDLSLLDRVNYKWCDVFDYVLPNCWFGLEAIMSAVFALGKENINEALLERIGYLEDTEKTYGLSEEQEKNSRKSEKFARMKTLKNITTI